MHNEEKEFIRRIIERRNRKELEEGKNVKWM